MRRAVRAFVALAVLAAGTLPAVAGFIRGVVVDHVSGRPLPRAVVKLEPIPAASGAFPQKTQTVRAGAGGSFAFTAQPGMYLLTATRESYFPVGHGSRRATGSPIPIEVPPDSLFQLFSELRMRRRGGVTGYVYDENGVPMAGIPVVAYRARMPLRTAGTATSDGRGIYRIGGLEPGRYWVRSAAQQLNDESSWLPTFGPGTRERSQAKMHAVSVENDTAYADINAEPGTLFHLVGSVRCPIAAAVIVTLSSETGTRQAKTACNGGYQFDGLSPATYEISAATEDGTYGGFIEVSLDRDSQSGTVELGLVKPVDVQVVMAGTNARPPVGVRIYGRRVNSAEVAPELEIHAQPAPLLAPGYWEIRVAPPVGYYVQFINSSGGQRDRNRPMRTVDGFELFLPPRTLINPRLVITLSDRPGRITGKVTTGPDPQNPNKSSEGAPVYLVPATPDARRALGGIRSVFTNTEGRYTFNDLPPGDYRLLASFDVADIEDDIPQAYAAETATVKQGEATERDLTLWRAPGF